MINSSNNKHKLIHEHVMKAYFINETIPIQESSKGLHLCFNTKKDLAFILDEKNTTHGRIIVFFSLKKCLLSTWTCPQKLYKHKLIHEHVMKAYFINETIPIQESSKGLHLCFNTKKYLAFILDEKNTTHGRIIVFFSFKKCLLSTWKCL